MSKITLHSLSCERKKDITGKDEPSLFIAGQEVWNGKIEKHGREYPNESKEFDNSVLVQLKESGNLLRSWTVSDQIKTNDDLVATSSGYHYVLVYSVSA